jgi:hypothetical protein
MSVTSEDDLKTLHINKCPQPLIDRVTAKAALKGMGISEWIISVLQRETRKLKPIQDEYRAEEKE